ncbi:MAG: hypothetical protein ACT4NY_13235 [Pseudonocardiales bacterium]
MISVLGKFRQLSDRRVTMRLRFLGKNSVPGDSPTLYATDRHSFIVQGWKVTDPEVLAKLDPPAVETCVEVPAVLFVHLAKDRLHGTIANWAPPIVHVTDKGNYIVQGKRVTDAEARAQMSILELEDCVEVTRAAIRALLLEEDNLGVDNE